MENDEAARRKKKEVVQNTPRTKEKKIVMKMK